MNVQQVASSTISALGYDDALSTLEVHFTSGAVYQYFDVPRQVYDDLVNSPSKGQYLNVNIKNFYRYMRL
jgi:hypothetical protein